MKAARNFSFGDGKDSHRFREGDEVPDKVVKALEKDGADVDTLILERAAKNSPESLTREQLMGLAGLNAEEIGAAEEPQMDEESMREGFANFRTKGDLVEWAEGVLNIEGLDVDWTRDEIEGAIVEAFFGDDEEPDSDEEDDEDNSDDE